MSFTDKYNKIKQLTSKELQIIEDKIIKDINLTEPLKSAVLDFFKAPSKRIRPVLSILYTKALGQDLTDEQLEILSAVEIVHNASLIHDDIIDNSEVRRGEKTISSNFGTKLGVITGDYLLSIAMNKISKLNSLQVLQNFSSTLRQMCIGEINQHFNKFKIITIEDYIEKSKNKTAYLFETAMLCPHMINNNNENSEYISKFGLYTGIAFQIRDDLLNLTNSDNTKPSENDITEGIYNAPVIYAGNAENYTNGIAKTKDLLNNYVSRAFRQLENLPENKYKESLKEFLELIKYE